MEAAENTEDYHVLLEDLNPSATLSVELPFAGNGNLYQVRTTVSDQIFYGRAASEEEAVQRCCKKAVRHLYKHRDANLNCPRQINFEQEARPPLPPQPPPPQRQPRHQQPRKRQPQESLRPPVHKRELELRSEAGEMAEILDRVASWNRKYSPKESTSGESRGTSGSAGNRSRGRANNNVNKRGGQMQEQPRKQNKKVPEAETLIEDDLDLDLGNLKLKPVQIKNAVMMLNEMFPPPKAPQYKVTSQTGPPNNPTFTMVCCISEQTFTGEGKSKKEAKLACSQKAIETICGYKMSETRSMPEKSNPRANCDLDDWVELEGKNPVSILNELYPGIQYQLLSTSGPSHAPQFVIKASLNDMSFEGSGKSKKDAKLNASKALLVHLHKVGFDPMTGDMMSTQQDNMEVASGHSFADQIGQLVTAKYQTLFGTTTYSKRRVMSGVVMSKNFGDIENTGEVICVSSGTKCINGEQLSLEGCVVNDSHAEIVTRRCLVVFLYQQLENVARNEESIFFKAEDGRYKLIEGIDFHLFITTSPCGDARIFSLHESPSNASLSTSNSASSLAPMQKDTDLAKEPEEPETVKPPPPPIVTVTPPEGDGDAVVETVTQKTQRPQTDSSRGMLRSKIECGMGTVPISPKMHLQTWDGVMSGDRLLTMACSDKILRWNVLGIQGALLTHLIRPIYLKSITVGSKFHPGHMKRALYERIANHVGPMPSEHYKLNVPQLYATTSPETRQATKAHDYSVNWIMDQGQAEIVNGSTGKTINDNTSRLSKKSLFGRFMAVGRDLMSLPFVSPIRYSAVKQLATEYQKAKSQVTTALVTAGCGHWVEKPVEQDQFLL